MKYPYYKISAIKELMTNEKMAPLKKWGQNFLLNPSINSAILQAIPLQIINEANAIAEIGPGLGVLTWELVQLHKQFYIFEIDPFFMNLLRENEIFEQPYVRLIEGDFLENIDSLKNEQVVLYGNLPYHLSSEIVTNILLKISGIKAASFLVQKEFAIRLVNEISSLSVFASAFGVWKIIKTVRPNNFYPKPNVDSAIITFIPWPENEIIFNSPQEIEMLSLFLRTIFWGKRKQIITSIKNSPFIQDSTLREVMITSLDEMNIKYTIRPEQLKKDEIYKLVKTILNNYLKI